MKNKVWLGSNWKMTKTTAEGIEFIQKLKLILDDMSTNIEVFIIPSYTSLQPIREAIGFSKVLLGAQNMHWEERGAFTGEISPLMLKEVPVDIVELGHSERRAYYNENDSDLNKKVHSALKHGFKALICIGENINDKEEGLTYKVLSHQLRTCLKNLTLQQATNFIVAYEPVWAIGEHGIPASVEYVSDIHSYIRSVLIELFPVVGLDIPILYGGSINQQNLLEYLNISEVNGLFIGRAAWDIDGFEKILEAVSRFVNFDSMVK